MLTCPLSVLWLEAFAIWRGLLLDAVIGEPAVLPRARVLILTVPTKKRGGRHA